MATDQPLGYGIKCEPGMSYSSDYFQTPPNFLQDSIPEGNEDGMDFSGLLEMDDKTLSELTNGVSSGEWNSSLFNGQLDGLDILDPTTGMPGGLGDPQGPASSPPVSTPSQPVDRWLMEETHKLERQQKLQQQKLLELQQTLLKTEILKNQLQIASISHSSQSHSTPPATTSSVLLSAIAGNGGTPRATPKANFNFTPSLPASSISGSGSGGVAPRVTLQQRGALPTTGSGSGGESPSDELDFPFQPEKRKVHNLIEKKYRCSINDRIGLLRDMVSKHSKDNKRLQKSAVLQKTIDYIHHLESQIRRLQEENHALRDTLAKVTGTPRLPSFSSPPTTPHSSVSPKSLESGEDSGNPSSPDGYLSDEYPIHEPSPALHQRAKLSILASHLVHGTSRGSNVPRFLMCVMLVAVFFINPLSFIGGQGEVHHAGSMRVLSASEEIEDGGSMMDTLMSFLSWGLRILIAAGCFGLMSLKSMPRILANSRDAVHFWRFRKQAEHDLQKGEFVKARENLEVALAVISRPTPTSYFGIVTGLVSSIFSHILFQLVIGQWAVSLASYLVRNRGIRGYGGKMTGLGVTFGDAAETYHLLHQINLATTGGTNLHGMGFFLALNSLNFAEAARPFKLLSDQKLAEMFFSLGLQCRFSFRPYGYYLPMGFYFFRSRTVSPSQLATPLKWAATPQGISFLMSAQWAPEIKLGSRLYQGAAALPIYSATRAFLKDQLQETFITLLLPDSAGGSHDPGSDSASATFKEVLHLAKEASSSLDCHGNKVEPSTDAGFAALQWWASVGLVASYWLAGEDSTAEEYYPAIETLSGDSTPVVTVLQLAFKAGRLLRRPPTDVQTPVSVLLQLCETTSLSLKNCVMSVLQDHSDCVENELHQLGLLLACDWLLEVRIKLWETHGKDSLVTKEITPGFYQDLDSLSQLATLLPFALSRVRLYKGCYQLMAGANPMQAQAMLSSTGRASFVRRRGQTKDPSTLENPALCSPEHAMAKLLAYKHLPPSLESPDSTAGDLLGTSYQSSGSSVNRSQRVRLSSPQDSKQTHI